MASRFLACPLAIPASGLALGALVSNWRFAPHLPGAPQDWIAAPGRVLVGLLVLLGLLAVAWGGRLGALTAAAALGAVLAVSVGPVRQGLAQGTPTAAVLEIRAPWQRTLPIGAAGATWTTTAQAVRLRQGNQVYSGGEAVRVRLKASSPPAQRWLRAKGLLRSPSVHNNRGAPSRRVQRQRRLRSLTIKSDRLVVVAIDHPSRPSLEGLGRARLAVRRLLERRFGSAPFMNALLIGDRGAIPDAAGRNLAIYGLSHLFALSGLHLGILLAAVAVGARAASAGVRLGGAGVHLGGAGVRLGGAGVRFGSGPWLGLLGTAAVAAAFVSLVGVKPSLARAGLMAAGAASALATSRRPWAWNLWSLALIALLVDRPAAVSELGFQLSFLATGGILVVAAQRRTVTARSWWRRLARWLKQAIAVSAAAQAASATVVVTHFQVIPLAAPLLNLLYVPWTGLALVGGLLLLPLGCVLDAAPWAALLSGPYEWAASWRPRPWLNLHASEPSLLSLLVAAATSLLLLRRARDRLGASTTGGEARLAEATHGSPTWRFCALLALLATIAGRTTCPSSSNAASSGRTAEAHAAPGARLTFWDVGQGDALLIESGTESVLVDGGGWARDGLGARVLVPALLRSGVRHIDLIVLTHSDRDHCGGLVEVAARLSVAEVWLTSAAASQPCGAELVGLVRGQGGRETYPRVAQERDLAGGRIRVLAARPRSAAANARSIVLEVELHGRLAWLLGDAPAELEHLVLERAGPVRRLDILKVAHHGSKTSSSGRLLQMTRPKWALIGVGAGNLYGHPAPPVLERLQRAGARVLQTDLHGQVTATIRRDGALLVEHESFPLHPLAPDARLRTD